MAQATNIRKGDARVFRLVVRTTKDDFLNLTGYQEALLSFFDTNGAVVKTWSTNTSSQAVFSDRVRGEVEFYVLSSDTNTLNTQQYSYVVTLKYNSDHIYTVKTGIVNVTEF